MKLNPCVIFSWECLIMYSIMLQQQYRNCSGQSSWCVLRLPFLSPSQTTFLLYWLFFGGHCLDACQNSCPGNRRIRPSRLQNPKAEGCLCSRDITANPSQAFEKLELGQWSAPKKNHGRLTPLSKKLTAATQPPAAHVLEVSECC